VTYSQVKPPRHDEMKLAAFWASIKAGFRRLCFLGAVIFVQPEGLRISS
jgi:hypothetical protein